MAVNAQEFYTIALESKALESEIGNRNCVSRAYYSMYHSVLAILDHDVPNYATGGAHHCLIEYLASSSSPESHDKRKLKMMSFILKQARDRRCDADYDIYQNCINNSSAEDALEQAKRIFNICNELEDVA